MLNIVVAKEMNLLAWCDLCWWFLHLTLKNENFNGGRHCLGEHLSLLSHPRNRHWEQCSDISHLCEQLNPTPLIKHTTQNHVNRRVRELGYLYTYCHQPLFPTFILLHRQSIRLVVLSAGYTEMVRVPIAFATVGVLAGEGSRRSQAKADSAWLVVRMPGSGVPEVDLANWMLPTFWILSRTNMGLPSLEEMHIQWWWVAP